MVSSSSRPRSRALARTIVFTLTVFASIATSTAVVGLDPAESVVPAESAPAPVIPLEALVAESLPAIPFADDCSRFVADFCVEVPPPNVQEPETVDSCTTGDEHQPNRRLAITPRVDTIAAAGNAIRVRIEVEEGLGVSAPCFATQVMSILNDKRGWQSVRDVVFTQVDGDSYDLRLILASPARTDELCYPARTAGKYSCRKENRVVLNLMRWVSGTDEYQDDLSTYRTYLVNHEVGHYLGRGHEKCPGAGEPAPLMMQQTKGLGECLPNGWPTKDEG